ncbi:MAG: DUF4340 domain-containing protein [Eubacteriales bacterium]|nr:DUF4340 domain-containing protein [Eubacteriales bacterium]
MKLYRNAAILVAVLAVILTAYFLIDRYMPKPEEETQTDGNIYTLIDLNYDQVENVEIDNRGLKMLFTRVGDEWGLSLPENVRSDKYKSKAVVLNLTPLKANKIIEDEAENLAKYGLDNPVTVTVRTKTGELHVVEFGNKTLTGENYYAKMKDDVTVYAVSDYYGGKLVIDMKYIMDKNLLTMEVEDITGFSLERDGQPVFRSSKLEDESWVLTFPVNGNVDLAKLQPVLETVKAMTANEFLDNDAASIKEYGLDDPRYAFEIKTAVGAEKVLIGKDLVKDTTAYGMLESSGSVFILPMSSLNFVDKPLKDILDIFVYIVNINDIYKLVTTFDGHTDEFDIAHTFKEDGTVESSRFFYKGEEITAVDDRDNNLFRLFYRALIGIPMSEVDLDATPSGAPEFTWTLYIREGSPYIKESDVMKIEFVSRDDFYYYVLRNGKYTGVLAPKKEFDNAEGVREEYARMIDSLAQ